ncbi:MAG: hypothetical protein ABTA24_14485 [Arthrobacter sp.]
MGSGAPGLLTIFTGARGIGKTVMLGAAHDLARESGWAVISETATPGFVGRIGESMRRLAEDLGDGPKTRRITAIAAAGFSITTQLPPERQVAWRGVGEELLNEGVATFLRRADKIDLHAAAVREVEESYAATFAGAGFQISPELVSRAALAGDIGRRLGAKTNLVANYRSRLLAAGLIESTGHGKVDFAIPGLRQHLRRHAGLGSPPAGA